jgi:hypothetical protein
MNGLVKTQRTTKRGALANWRQYREGLVRVRKESNQGRHTSFLEKAEQGTCQDKERKQPSEVPSLSGDGGRDLSGHRKKVTERGALTFWRRQRGGLVRYGKKTTERGELTSWR